MTYDPAANSKGCFDLAISSLRERLEASKVTIRDCTLYCEDAEFIVPTLMKVDALVTDPPYGIGVDKAMHKASGTKYGVAMAAKRCYDDTDWDSKLVDPELINTICGKTKWQIIFGGNYYALPPTTCWLVWDKQTNGEFADCELAWTNLPIVVKRLRFMWNGMLRAGGEGRGDHPTQKPIGVMKWCIEHLPADVSTILDPFMGSGTTGVAAVKLGKKFIGIERERKYFDIAVRRIEEAYKQPDLFVSPPEKKPEQMGFAYEGDSLSST